MIQRDDTYNLRNRWTVNPSDSCKERRNGDDKAHPRRIVGHMSLLTKVAAYTLVFALCAIPMQSGDRGKYLEKG